MKTLYDIVIIGSGPGGYRAAILAALRKQKVAIIEKQDWGGCCLNRGCVPKKTWHNTAKLLSKNKSLKKIGICGELKPDFNRAWQHQKDTVTTVRNNYLSYMKRLGIDYFNGHGKIAEPFSENNNAKTKKIISINIIGQDAQLLNTKHVIIATGATAYRPQFCTTSGNKVLSTDDIFDRLPPEGNDVAIIGGGVIAVEFSYILQALGKNIYWYSRSPALSKSDFSEQAIKLLKEQLGNLSLTSTQVLPDSIVEREGKVHLCFNDSRLNQSVDWVLLATGRIPFSTNLGLENTRVKQDADGFIKTNQYLETNETGIYAIGDVRCREMTANHAINDANIAVENIINGNHQGSNENWVPQAIYSALEMAKVGLNEDQAEDLDYEPAVGFSAFESSPCAIGQDSTEGYMRLIADMDSGELLGGEIVGENAAELIQLMAMHKDTKTALRAFSELTVNHPSRAEELVNATETLANKWGLADFVFPTDIKLGSSEK